MGLTHYQAAVARDAVARTLFLLPHEARRRVYRRLLPKQHKLYADMRKYELGVVPGQAISLTAFDRHKCIFVHIPKCAGISVGKALFGDYEGNHLPIPVYQLIFSKQEFDEYFKFSFVRNPWDRLLSGYRFMNNGGVRLSPTLRQSRDPQSIKSMTRDEIRQFDDFEHFVTTWVTPENLRVHEHFRPQHRFVCSVDNKLQLDYVARFESLQDDLAHIAERLGVDTSLVHENRTVGASPSYRDMYTPKMRAVVERLYGRDIRLFGYHFDDG